MKCPNCGVLAPAGAQECAACGVIFAKFKKKFAELELPPPAKINLWKGRVIALAIVALWLGSIIVYYHGRLGRMPKAPGGSARAR